MGVLSSIEEERRKEGSGCWPDVVSCTTERSVFWADTVGSTYIFSKLKKLGEAYGGFCTPSKYLEERAAERLPLQLKQIQVHIDDTRHGLWHT
ncbi:uncharacterized protein LOC110021864 isoform X2 [Phalaenopsis equestris]|uniref:uncharacterized protein LOC110021864 isoform X2 n=1 Tax=Phalaenopsis equestris TaxID=78828 RepID=UPI0009E582B4|nr:uncharacterized protein LOC110021864 isoform X2 [Phalaenopsis equestris]